MRLAHRRRAAITSLSLARKHKVRAMTTSWFSSESGRGRNCSAIPRSRLPASGDVAPSITHNTSDPKEYHSKGPFLSAHQPDVTFSFS